MCPSTLCPTPSPHLQEDAGADLTFEFPFPSSPDLNGWLGTDAELLPGHLPDSSWPRPDNLAELGGAGSPFSGGPRDYLRVAGPGLFVGCAYRPSSSGGGLTGGGGTAAAVYNEEDCVYFVMARKTSRADYIRQLDAEQLDSEDEGRSPVVGNNV